MRLLRTQLNNATERVRYLYESVNALNNTLTKLIPVASEIAKNLTEEERRKYYDETKVIVEKLICELKAININLQQLQKNIGMIKFAVNGDVDSLLINLCQSVDNLTYTLETFMKRGDLNGKR